MMNPKVSIVVPIYNGEKYIDNCINNIKRQTYQEFELILVDDGSTDNTAKICDSYAEDDKRIKVIHQKNKGLSAARNAGTRSALGEYLVYVDVDDDITNSLLEDNVLLAVKNDADVVMYNFWYYNVDTKEKKENLIGEGFVGNSEEFFKNFLIKALSHEVFNAPWNKLYKLSFLRDNNLKFFEEYPIYEDIIFGTKMFQFAEKIVVNDNMYYVYYVRSSGSLITKYVDGYFKSVSKFYSNALDYCSKYQENEEQKKKFAGLYVRLVTTNLKQISCNDKLDKEQKQELISNICNDELFRSALKTADLGPRKMFVKHFALTGNSKAVETMYKFLGNFR